MSGCNQSCAFHRVRTARRLHAVVLIPLESMHHSKERSQHGILIVCPHLPRAGRFHPAGMFSTTCATFCACGLPASGRFHASRRVHNSNRRISPGRLLFSSHCTHLHPNSMPISMLISMGPMLSCPVFLVQVPYLSDYTTATAASSSSSSSTQRRQQQPAAASSSGSSSKKGSSRGDGCTSSCDGRWRL